VSCKIEQGKEELSNTGGICLAGQLFNALKNLKTIDKMQFKKYSHPIGKGVDMRIRKMPGRNLPGNIALFTIIELLVVISIIAILASVLLPALQKAKMTGNKIKCTSNLKQIFTATSLYLNDNGGYLPVKEAAGDNKYWSVKLGGYLQADDVYKIQKRFLCPSVKIPLVPADWNQIDYAYNYYFMYYPDFNPPPFGKYYGKFRSSQIKFSETMYCMDGARLTGHQYIFEGHVSDPTYYSKIFFHLNNANACFMDGHITEKKRNDIPVSAYSAFWTGN